MWHTDNNDWSNGIVILFPDQHTPLDGEVIFLFIGSPSWYIDLEILVRVFRTNLSCLLLVILYSGANESTMGMKNEEEHDIPYFDMCSCTTLKNTGSLYDFCLGNVCRVDQATRAKRMFCVFLDLVWPSCVLDTLTKSHSTSLPVSSFLSLPLPASLTHSL